MAAVKRNLTVEMGLKAAKFYTDVDKAKAKVQAMSDKFNASMKVVGAAGAAAAGGLALVVRQSLAAAGALDDTSQKLGIATEKLGGLHLAAQLSGVATTTFDMALQRMTRRLSEAAIGTGEAQGALKELGLDAKKLNDMSPDKAFQELAAAMEKIPNQADKVRLSFKLFDSEGVALVNTMNMGKEGIAAVMKEATALGVAYNDVDSAKMVAAGDAMLRISVLSQGVGNQFTIAVAPAITLVADQFRALAIEHNGFKEEAKAVAQTVIFGAGKMAEAYVALSGGVEAEFYAITGGAQFMMSEILGGVKSWMFDLAKVVGAFDPDMETKILNAAVNVAKSANDMGRAYKANLGKMDSALINTAAQIKAIQTTTEAMTSAVETGIAKAGELNTAAGKGAGGPIGASTGAGTKSNGVSPVVEAAQVEADTVVDINKKMGQDLEKEWMSQKDKKIMAISQQLQAAITAGQDEQTATEIYLALREQIEADFTTNKLARADEVTQAAAADVDVRREMETGLNADLIELNKGLSRETTSMALTQRATWETTGQFVERSTKQYFAKAAQTVIKNAINAAAAALGMGAGASSGFGATKGGVLGAIAEGALFLGKAAVNYAAAREIAKNVYADGGYVDLGANGLIRSGTTGRADDVLVRSTPTSDVYASRGEYIMNEKSTSANLALLEVINKSRGRLRFADGGLNTIPLPGSTIPPPNSPYGKPEPIEDFQYMLRKAQGGDLNLGEFPTPGSYADLGASHDKRAKLLADNFNMGASLSFAFAWAQAGDYLQGIPPGAAAAIKFMGTGIGSAIGGKNFAKNNYKAADGGYIGGIKRVGGSSPGCVGCGDNCAGCSSKKKMGFSDGGLIPGLDAAEACQEVLNNPAATIQRLIDAFKESMRAPMLTVTRPLTASGVEYGISENYFDSVISDFFSSTKVVKEALGACSPDNIAQDIGCDLGLCGVFGGPSGIPGIPFLANGFDGYTNGPTMFVAGERGKEHVKVTPMTGSRTRERSEIHIHFDGPVYADEDYLRETIAPMVQRVIAEEERITYAV